MKKGKFFFEKESRRMKKEKIRMKKEKNYREKKRPFSDSVPPYFKKERGRVTQTRPLPFKS